MEISICTTRSAMNHIVAPRPVEPVAGEFYKHPYGGIARDIHVSKEGFARFFEWSLAEVDFAMLVSNGGKVIDDLSDNHECLGYVHQNPHGRRDYMITIIDRTTKAAQKHLVRTIEQYNLKDVDD